MKLFKTQKQSHCFTFVITYWTILQMSLGTIKRFLRILSWSVYVCYINQCYCCTGIFFLAEETAKRNQVKLSKLLWVYIHHVTTTVNYVFNCYFQTTASLAFSCWPLANLLNFFSVFIHVDNESLVNSFVGKALFLKK